MKGELKYGVGVFEEGKFKAREKLENGKYKTCGHYNAWMSMLDRCYNTPSDSVRFKKYTTCEVCKEWHYFQNFAEWYNEHYVDGYQLDKDILVKGNKVYSPETCCFVPQEINNLIENRDQDRGDYPVGVSLNKTCKHSVSFRARCSVLEGGKRLYKSLGCFDTKEKAFEAYKVAKEKNVRSVISEYYKDGKVSEKVYMALINYTVNIED